MHIQTVLEQLGFPSNQVKIYLASLKMGEAKIADLSEQVAMPRTTVAELLEEMHKHGLMNYYQKRGHKFWLAENPDKLMVMLKEREAALGLVLPQLNAMRNHSSEDKPQVRLYTGAEEIKLILDDIVESRHHILALVSEDDFREYMGAEYMDDFIERRKQHFLNIKFIGPRTERTKFLKHRDADDSRHTRFLPEQAGLRQVSNFIYGDKVAIISLNQKEPTGMVIQDPNVARAMTIYFDSLWHHSSEQ